VLGDIGRVSFGWFTYASGAPAAPSGEHTWYTALGPRRGDRADVILYRTTGGAFDRIDPVNTEAIGTAELQFSSCDEATLRYAFSAGASGEIPLRRVSARPGCVAAELALRISE